MERSEAYLDAKEELHKLENEIQEGLEGEPRVTIGYEPYRVPVRTEAVPVIQAEAVIIR